MFKRDGEQDHKMEIEQNDSLPVNRSEYIPRSDGKRLSDIYPERRTLDRLLVPFAVRCMNAPIDQIDNVIEEGLKDAIDFFGGDRAIIWEIAEDGRQAILTHYHADAGFEPPDKAQLHENLPYMFGGILELQTLCISNLDDLPPSAQIDRQYLERSGVRSFIVIPLIVSGFPRGALSMACIRAERAWTHADLSNFQRIGVVIAGALDRKRSHVQIDQRMRFEAMLADLSAGIIKSMPSEIDAEIERGLARVTQFFQGDRCGLLNVDIDHKSVHVSHAYYAEGVARVSPDVEIAALFPWCFDEIIARKRPINLTATQMAALPREAETDRRSWAAMGVRSNLTIPLFTGERLEHVIVIHSMSEERAWPEEYIPRLRLLGELFVNAIIRKRTFALLRENEARLASTVEELKKSYGDIARLKDELQAENVYLRKEIGTQRDIETIIGRSDPIKYVHYRINQVAALDTTVLVVGETGTGKGLVARAVHERSLRKERPMIHVNCAVLPANLIESELFGREKGAFTGAEAKQIGRFELAHNGTIFLDEIAELPVELQAKLLRVVEDGEFERLGAPHTVKVDVRIIASTNRNLQEEINKGRFREDLFYRLNVFPITVPPLSQRTEDIPLIVDALIERMNKQLGRKITTVPRQVIRVLQGYSWPGNVRELENVIERAIIMTRGHVLQLVERLGNDQPPAVESVGETAHSGLADVERSHIRKTLETLKWKIEGPDGAANALGLKPSTLRTRMQKLNIRRPKSP